MVLNANVPGILKMQLLCHESGDLKQCDVFLLANK